MSRSSKKVQMSGAGHGARARAAFSLADLSPAALFEEPTPRYLLVRQLTGKHNRINLDDLRLDIHRPRRIAR